MSAVPASDASGGTGPPSGRRAQESQAQGSYSGSRFGKAGGAYHPRTPGNLFALDVPTASAS